MSVSQRILFCNRRLYRHDALTCKYEPDSPLINFTTHSSTHHLSVVYSAVLTRLNQAISNDEPIVGADAGTDISAKFTERGGGDQLIRRRCGIGFTA